MLKNQNSIDLNPFNSRYDEILIRANETATVLPGAIVEFRDELNDNYRGGYMTKKYSEGVATNPYITIEEKVTDTITVLYKGTPLEQVKHETTYNTEKVTKTLDNFDIENFSPAVVLENSIIGRSLNHKNPNDNVSRCRRLVPGDKFLIRAVADTYTFGDPLYAIQTDNGIYVTKEKGGMYIGWCEEDYTITEDMVDVVDNYEFPLPIEGLRGKLVNLLAVRISVPHKVSVIPKIEGITFANADTAPSVYDGDSYTASDFIDIDGTETGDEVTYVIENMATGTVVSDIKGSGQYKITVTVTREGHKPLKEVRYVTIEKKQLTVTGTTVEDKTYDGTNEATVVIGTVSGISGSDDFEITAVGRFDNANVGEDKTVTVVYSVPLAYAGNYIAPASETFTANINEVERIELTINSVQITDKVYDATIITDATVNISNTGGADVQVVCTAHYTDANAGNNKTVYLSDFEIIGADKDLFKLPETLPTTTTGNILKALLTFTGSYVTPYAYDGLTDIRSKIHIGEISGIPTDPSNVSFVVGSATLDNANVGQHTLAVTYNILGDGKDNYYTNEDSITVTILPATITGIEVTSVDIVQGEQSNINITGTEPGDTIVYSYGGNEYNLLPTINTLGEATVGIRISRANYTDWVGTTTFNVTENIVPLDYTFTANGSSSPAVSSTMLTMRFDENPGIISNDSIRLTGNAVVADDEDYAPVRIGNTYVVDIPIQFVGNTETGVDTVTFSIEGNARVTSEEKQTTTYMVMGMWGIYPCQFSGRNVPTATQILEMENNNGLLTAIPTFTSPTNPSDTLEGFACDFVISEADWNKEILENNASDVNSGYTEDDLNFANASGYEFILYRWDGISGVTVVNGNGVVQTDGFVLFTTTIRGVQYNGLVSRLANKPSEVGDNTNPTFYFIFSKD